ncbi:SIMPL domain-containing protein [uncultured Sphingomonas sp.]|uniref:SIMPL domain-containing protein n=1 Tax=uncultured Sphingomonas sp. TaxID=158754 RepID=UPI0025FC34B4|nr:SIMPL domain-containing protein [uncultured Sphingomonas sp.]
MRTKSFVLALALIVPGVASAQGGQPVTLEIVGNGWADVKPGKVTLEVGYIGKGKTEAEAKRDSAALLAKIEETLKAQGLSAAAITNGEVDSLSKLRAEQMQTEDADSASDAAPIVTDAQARLLIFSTTAQADAVKEKLHAMDFTIGTLSAQPDIAGVDAAFKQVKAMALRNARADAELYAKEMGLRVARVVRISETGSGPITPGLQTKLELAMSQGPQAVFRSFKREDASTHVEKALVVTFELQ